MSELTPRDTSNRLNPAIMSLLVMVGIGFLIYSLIGMITGYLIIPIRSGEPIELEGFSAHLGGTSGTLVLLAFFVKSGRYYQRSRPMKVLTDVVLYAGVLGMIATAVIESELL